MTVKYEVFAECRTCGWSFKSHVPTVKANLRNVGTIVQQHLREHLRANPKHEGILPGPRRIT